MFVGERVGLLLNCGKITGSGSKRTKPGGLERNESFSNKFFLSRIEPKHLPLVFSSFWIFLHL